MRGADTGLTWERVNPFVMHFCVPVILIYLGLKISPLGFREQWKTATLYAVLGGSAFGLLCSIMLSVLIGSPAGFPLSAALLAATLLSVSDLSTLRETQGGLQRNDAVRQRLEIESLMLGAVGGTFFTAFVMPDVNLNPLFWVIELSRSAVISLILGAVLGVVLNYLLGKSKSQPFSIIGLAMIVAGTLATNALIIHLDASVTLFAVTLALMLRGILPVGAWRPVNAVAVVALLLIAGASFTPELFVDRWLAMLIGAGLTIIGRVITTLPIFWILFELKVSVTDNEPWLATFASPRGAITLALAISIPLDFPAWYTVQAIVYGGVLASMLASALTSILLHKQVKL